MPIQLSKTPRRLPGEKVLWPGVLVLANFPEEIMITEYARIRILTLQVRFKLQIVGQIWSQIENLGFLEIWDVPWISMATTRRVTFTLRSWHPRRHATASHRASRPDSILPRISHSSGTLALKLGQARSSLGLPPQTNTKSGTTGTPHTTKGGTGNSHGNRM